jgi:hypothetical protein
MPVDYHDGFLCFAIAVIQFAHPIIVLDECNHRRMLKVIK